MTYSEIKTAAQQIAETWGVELHSIVHRETDSVMVMFSLDGNPRLYCAVVIWGNQTLPEVRSGMLDVVAALKQDIAGQAQ